MKFLWLCLLGILPAHAIDVKISQLPLGSALTSQPNDSFPYVDSTSGVTKRLKLADIPKLPSFSNAFAPTANPIFTGAVTAPLFIGALNGPASTFSGSLQGDVTGTQMNTQVLSIGGSGAANVHSAELAANAATSANTPSTIVSRDANGITRVSSLIGNVTGNLTGNVSGNVSGSAGSFSGNLLGDVTGTQSATNVAQVGGSSALNVHNAELAANSATSANTPSKIVARDSSGNFSAGTITANLTGNASTATSATSATTAGTATNFTGSLSGDVSGTQGATIVGLVGGSSASNVHSAELLANGATNQNTPSTLIKRDSSGNFSAGAITASLVGNATSATSATTAGSATNFTGSLSGDVTGTQSATAVALVGGSSAANVHSAEQLANAATNVNTPSTLVSRDASGNFSAGTITAALSGNATSATTANTASSFTGSLVGDVTGTQGATVVSLVGGSSATNVHNAELLANAATAANTASAIVKRDSSGNFVAGTITANLTGTASGNLTAAGTATLTNKTMGDALSFTQIGTPSTPASGFNKIYPKTDGKFYTLDSTGTETALGSGSSGGNSSIDVTNSSDWVSYSLPITGASSNPTFGTISVNVAKWRRVGDSMQISFSLTQSSAGTAGSGAYLYGLPSGYTIDTNKVRVATTPGSGGNVGSASTNYVNNDYVGIVKAYDSTRLAILIADGNNSTISAYQGSASGMYGAAPISVSFFATVPITGWTSTTTVQLNSASVLTPLVVKAKKTSTVTTGAGVPIVFDTIVHDTSSSALSTSTGIFTAQKAGYYHFSGALSFSPTTSASIVLYKNNAANTVVGSLINNGVISYATDVQLAVGDTAFISTDGSSGFGNNSTLSIFQIH